MDIASNLPIPTKEDPYSQVKYIFNLYADTKSSKHTKDNYITGLNYYLKFLQETNNYDTSLEKDPRFFLIKHWDEFCLEKLERFIKDYNKKRKGVYDDYETYKASYTITGYVSAIRKVIEFAFYHNLCKSDTFFNVILPPPSRETKQRESYSDNELKQINNMLLKELGYVRKVINGEGYKKTGVGKDPRYIKRVNVKRGEKVDGYGWKELDNLRWYFENVMNCTPLSGTPENKKTHNSFFANATNNFYHIGGLNGVYKVWGVSPLINAELIMPLAVKLILETGLNPESLLGLEVDCYNNTHPLSGVPYLKYFKRRSKGEKELHLSGDTGIDLVTKELRNERAIKIERIINQILYLTESIRDTAPSNLKNKLFLYQSDSNKSYGDIKVINKKTTSNWCKKMVNRYQLVDDNNATLLFNLARFRPTHITKMVEVDKDFFEIQQEAGHSNIRTTLNYINKNKLNIKSKEKINSALETISNNNRWATNKNSALDNMQDTTKIYKGIICDCKNPFDPPKEVKKLKDYQDGQSCNRYNMCLSCHNIIIFKHHLPQIASYRKQIVTALNTPDSEVPNDIIYKQTLSIIDALLDPNISEFEEEDINTAIEIGETSDIIVDLNIYKPIIDK